jgi:hypothetical protein
MVAYFGAFGLAMMPVAGTACDEVCTVRDSCCKLFIGKRRALQVWLDYVRIFKEFEGVRSVRRTTSKILRRLVHFAHNKGF